MGAVEGDKKYTHADAAGEMCIADIDWDIFQAMAVAIGQEPGTEEDRKKYEEQVEVRTAAKVGCEEGRLAVWEEEAD